MQLRPGFTYPAFFFLALLPAVLAAAQPGARSTPASSIRIGAILSLSSYGAPFGQPEANGALMAVEELNAEGAGPKVELVIEDNQTSMTETVKAFQKLTGADQVPAILGPNWAEFSELLAPLAEQRRIVLLSASGWTQNLTAGRAFVFTTMARHDDVTRPLAERIARDGAGEVVLAVNPNAYLESVADALTRELAKQKISVRERALFNPGTQDYRSFIGRMKEQGEPALVLMLIQSGENAAFLRQLRALQYRGRLYASNNLLQEDVILQNLSLAEGVTAFEYRYIRDVNHDFVRRYRERFGVPPNESAPRAYDNARLLVQTMRECGVTSDEIRRCLDKADFRGISGRIRFGKDHNVLDSFGLSQVVQVRKGAVAEAE